MAAIDDAIRVHAALASQQDKKLAAGSSAPPGGVVSLLTTFQIGDTVLDLVTGQQGVVIDGKRENVIIPAAGQAGN